MKIHLVYFDVSIDGAPSGRIIMELYEKFAPRTVENFRALCTGEVGKGERGNLLHFKGSKLHVVSPGKLKGGAIGEESIYGGEYYDGLVLQHTGRGALCLANGTSGTEFLISLVPEIEWERVVFGQVIEGLEICETIVNSGKASEIVIDDCDELS